MADDGGVLLRRYCAYDTPAPALFHFVPSSGELRAAPAGTLEADANGWLVDNEWVVAGDKRVILYRKSGKRFVVLGSTQFEIGEGKCFVSHYKSMLFSEFLVQDGRDVYRRVKYMTPWWRLVFDDGQAPESHFPLEMLSQRFFGCDAALGRESAR